MHRSISQPWLNDKLEDTEESELPLAKNELKQRKILWWVLGINFAFFVVEMTTGWISRSMGLIADSLDIVADSIVYGLSLLAVGPAISRKKKIAKLSGYFQMRLALLGFAKVLRNLSSTLNLVMFKILSL